MYLCGRQGYPFGLQLLGSCSNISQTLLRLWEKERKRERHASNMYMYMYYSLHMYSVYTVQQYEPVKNICTVQLLYIIICRAF